MASVTQRIKQIQQPKGGYIPARSFHVEKFEDQVELGEENIHASIVGLAVDYLTRYMRNKNAVDAFKISLMGARNVNKGYQAQQLVQMVKGMDDYSIISACQLAGFDVCYRRGSGYYKPVEEILPNKETIENIRIMVKRSINFFDSYGPVVKDGFTFEGGYTQTVHAGDGDFLTKDTLWDFKVSKNGPTKDHTLQLLMYYIMGRKSIHREFDTITKLGIYNPRLNRVYMIAIDKIPIEIIKEVGEDVIGYGENSNADIQNKNEQIIHIGYMSATEVASVLGVSKSKVYHLIKTGKLPAERQGNKYIIKQQIVEVYVEDMMNQMRMQRNVTVIINYFAIVSIILVLLWVISSCLPLLL